MSENQSQLQNFITQQTIDDSNDESTQLAVPVDTEALDSEAAIDLCEQFPKKTLKRIVIGETEQTTIFGLLKEVSESEAVLSSIETLKQFRLDTDEDTNPEEVVEDAAETLEQRLGSRPFEWELQEPNTEFLGPKLETDVNSLGETTFTENPEINAAILNHATRMRAETKSGQERLTERWSEYLGEDELKEFKLNHHPDALGFAHPELIPATGNNLSRTAITEVPHIGPKTAASIHPNEELLAIEDLVNLTEKQFSCLEFHHDPTEITNKKTTAFLKAALTALEKDHSKAIARVLSFTEHESEEIDLLYANRTYGPTAGIMPPDPVADTEQPVPTISKQQDSNRILPETDGREIKIKADLFKLLTTIADHIEKDIYTTDIGAHCYLPDGNIFIVAKRIDEESTTGS